MFKKTIRNQTFSLSDNGVLSIPKYTSDQIKVAIIMDSHFEIPPVTGFTYRMTYLSQALMRQGVEILWILCNRGINPEKDLKSLESSGIPMYILGPKDFYNITLIENLLRKSSVNVLQFESTQTYLQIGRFLQRKLNISTLLEFHDIESSISQAMNLKEDIDLLKYMQYVSSLLADYITCFTDYDKNLLINDLEVPHQKISISSNGINPSSVIFQIGEKKRNDVIILGNFFYPPNQEALFMLTDQILPIILQKYPDARVKSIGMTPEWIKEKYSNIENVYLMDKITDKKIFQKELSSSKVAMCNVLSGSGMNIKILDYATACLPIITTTIGARGYEKIRDLVITSESPHEIATKILDFLEDSSLTRKVGLSISRDMIKYYSWEHIAQLHIKNLQKLSNLSFTGNKPNLHNNFTPLWLKEGRDKTIETQGIITINI